LSKKQAVSFRDRDDWFWAYDVGLGVLLKHLIDVATEGEADPWVDRVLAEWRTTIEVAGSGLGLDLGIGWSALEVDRFLEMVDKACDALSCREGIPAAEIQSWSVFANVQNPARGAAMVHTAPVIELGRAIQALVHGTLPEPPPGVCWFYGTPEGRIVLRLPAQ
jgi:hypothetical protein